MVIIARSCSSAKTRNSSVWAIEPSSFWLTISQIAPAGCRPAIRARSTAASV